ncbi:hypothetical protein E2C01_036000 [Portunus trituberculatus]|uniref:Uncharacterized protein n=1 Tax=Portunus trituberculatus TaxID=210409 RepID=A0A5B7FAT6_PORTR|nr:hypothetical protein [Portunus trituberculatus]
MAKPALYGYHNHFPFLLLLLLLLPLPCTTSTIITTNTTNNITTTTTNNDNTTNNNNNNNNDNKNSKTTTMPNKRTQKVATTSAVTSTRLDTFINDRQNSPVMATGTPFRSLLWRGWGVTWWPVEKERKCWSPGEPNIR